MPTVVVCPCSARLKVGDALAGKQVKCPKCGDMILVPAALDYEEVPDEPAPPPRKKPRVVDEDEDDAPRPPRKKKDAPLEVDEAVDDDEEDEKPRKKKSRVADDDDDDDDRPRKKSRRDDDDDRPRKKGEGKGGKKQAKSNLPLLLGIGGGVLALVVVGVVVTIIVMNSGKDTAKGTPSGLVIPPPPGGGPIVPPLPGVPGGGGLPQGWSNYKGDGFSVGVPEIAKFGPQGGNVPRPKPDGGTETTAWTNGTPPTPGQAVYVVTFNPLPAEMKTAIAQDKANFVKMVKLGAAFGGGRGPKMEDVKTVTMGGEEAVQFTVKQGVASGYMRLGYRGDRMYTWGVMAQTLPDENDPNVKSFLDSFKPDDTPAPAGGGTKPPPSPVKLPPAVLPDGWTKFGGEGFSVGVPAKADLPKEASTDFTPIPPLTSAKRWNFTYFDESRKVAICVVEKLGVDNKFQASYGTNWNTALDTLAAGGTVGTGGKKDAEVKTASVGGVEGRQVKFDTGGAMLIRRMVVKDGVLYVVTAMVPGVTDETDPKVKPFLDSFRFE